MSAIEAVVKITSMRPIKIIVLACTMAGMAALSFVARTSIHDPDTWWHLAVGDWIVQHRDVPHLGIFSWTAASRPWIAYSWGYEVLLSRAYAWFGLTGFALFGILLTIAIAFILFWTLLRVSGRFWVSWILIVVGCFAYLFSLMPRPVFFSMALFNIMLALILEAQRSGRVQTLFILPILFMLWANLHIQFVYGLCVLGLFVAVHAVHKLLDLLHFTTPKYIARPILPLNPLLATLVASLLATCIGPYAHHVYEVLVSYSHSHVPYTFIQELQPPDFAYFTDYFFVFLVAAGFVALFWKRKVDLFKLTLLVVATVSAFRTSRDAFFASIPAALFIAELFYRDNEAKPEFRLRDFVYSLPILAVLLFAIGNETGFTQRNLDRTISRNFPVDAVNFLRRNPTPGPLFNDINWGGFLIWYSPDHPVSIDGRNDLYGDEMDSIALASRSGNYSGDPYLRESRLVILPKELPLASALKQDPDFRLIYEDQMALVFARQQ